MTRIKLTEELRDYIESLQYQASRYQDLLNTVNRECCPMTDEEWNSSLEYFSTLYQEANICLNAAKQEINEMYAEEIQGQPWCINFIDCELIIGTLHTEPRVEKRESYADQLRRLFPREAAEPIKMNGTHCKDVTLQVTDRCNMACHYCLVAGTKILLPDYTTKNIEDVVVGDKVLAFPEYPNTGKQDTLEVADVTAVFKRSAKVIRITLDNGQFIDITENHPVLVRRNSYNHAYDYKEAGNLSVGQSVYCAPIINNDPPVIDDDYRIGYLVGMILGDGSLKKYKIKKWQNSWVYKFRLALKDVEAIKRSKEYLDYFGIDTYMKLFKISTKHDVHEYAIFSCTKDTYNTLSDIIYNNFRSNKSISYFRGFLAGIYDAEGSISNQGTIRICNTDINVIDEIVEGMSHIGIEYVVETDSGTKNKEYKWNVRVLAFGKECNYKAHYNMDFIMKVNPAISRKGFDAFLGRGLIRRAKIVSIEHLPDVVDVYNFETTLHTYFANNVAVHNCYQHQKSNHSMPFDVAKKFIDMILDSDERTNTYITSTESDGIILNFIGGEPWLEIDLISKVSDYFIGEVFRRKHPWAIKFCLNICSNGLLHFDPKVQAFIKRHKQHFHYNISIDGNKELHDSCRVDLAGHGTYDRAIAGVNDFRDTFKGKMSSKMTIAPGNIDKVFSAVSYMIESSNYRHINLNCVYEEGWTNEYANILYWELHKLTDWLFDNNLQDSVTLSIFSEHCAKPLDPSNDKNWCGGVGLMVAVDYKGDIYPCLRYMESSVADDVPAYIIGNIDDGINRKPEHCERIDCLKCVTRRSQSTDECFNCPIAMGCGWCSAHNYQTFGTVNKRTTFSCCMHKARSLANVYYWRRRGVDLPMHCPKDWAVEIIGEEEYEKLNSMKVGDV